MDSPPHTNASRPAQGGFTLVELLMVLTPILFIGLGVVTAYMFLGRNFIRLGNTQQQDVASRRILRQFNSDVSQATGFSTITSSNLSFTVPMSLTNCSTTKNSTTVTCASTAGMLAGASIWGTADPLKLTNCSTTVGSKNVTCASTLGMVTGTTVSGTNIPAGTTISSISNGTTFVMSANATASGSSLTFYTSTTINSIPINATVSSITNGTTFVLAAGYAATWTTTGATLYTTVKYTYAYDSVSARVTRTNNNVGSSSLTVLLSNIDTSAANGFNYYTESGTTAGDAMSVKGVSFAFKTTLGSNAVGTQSAYVIASPIVMARNKTLMQ